VNNPLKFIAKDSDHVAYACSFMLLDSEMHTTQGDLWKPNKCKRFWQLAWNCWQRKYKPTTYKFAEAVIFNSFARRLISYIISEEKMATA